MNILSWLVLGALAGMIARAVVGSSRRGCSYTVILGIAGAFVGGFLFNQVGKDTNLDEFSWGSIFAAIVGASVLLLLSERFERPRRGR